MSPHWFKAGSMNYLGGGYVSTDGNAHLSEGMPCKEIGS